MRNRYLRTLLTPEVQAEQIRAYGRTRVPQETDMELGLGAEERTFIAHRDSFYLASVTEEGWPYVQHRGGPPGFLHVASPTTLLFPDYNGNRQLISAANVVHRRRVALFLMDYVARERLKILGHADVLSAAEAEAWLRKLAVPPRTQVERVIRLEVVGYDWNCSKYITPRFTSADVEATLAPLRTRIADLEAQLRTEGPAA